MACRRSQRRRARVIRVRGNPAQGRNFVESIVNNFGNDGYASEIPRHTPGKGPFVIGVSEFIHRDRVSGFGALVLWC